jgi:hypothetical protein
VIVGMGAVNYGGVTAPVTVSKPYAEVVTANGVVDE